MVLAKHAVHRFPRATFLMKNIRLRVAALATFAAVALSTVTACGRQDAPTAAPADTTATPVVFTAEQQQLLGGIGELVGGLLTKPNLGLLPCSSPNYGTQSKVIGRAGGVITVGPHSLIVPPNALDKNVTIKATAPKGSRIEVRFEPHGLKFRYGAALTLSYKHCLLPPLTPSIVYVDSKGRILEHIPSLGILKSTVTGKIDHFSGYAVAD
jgi:hypothetical protein